VSPKAAAQESVSGPPLTMSLPISPSRPSLVASHARACAVGWGDMDPGGGMAVIVEGNEAEGFSVVEVEPFGA
jgi:hypothetical protein